MPGGRHRHGHYPAVRRRTTLTKPQQPGGACRFASASGRRRPVPLRLPPRRKQLDGDPALIERLTTGERAAIVGAAEAGDTAAVTLMLDLGFSAGTRRDDRATPLHAAAYAGSADTVRLLIGRGADIEARDASWDSTPIEWAAVGSGEQPRDNPSPDWLGTVRALLDAGAAADRIRLAPGDPKPPSAEVAALLGAHARAQASR